MCTKASRSKILRSNQITPLQFLRPISAQNFLLQLQLQPLPLPLPQLLPLPLLLPLQLLQLHAEVFLENWDKEDMMREKDKEEWTRASEKVCVVL